MLTRPDITGGVRALASACLAGVLLVASASSAPAQEARPDARWQAWLGCWQPAVPPLPAAGAAADSAQPAMVCVLPAEGASAVDIATVVDRQVVTRTHLDATGTRRAVTKDECSGWESAQWSPEGRRVYLRSEFTCPGGVQRRSNGVLAMTAAGEWLDVQGIAAGASQGVRVVRYREATDSSALPAELAASLRGTRTMAVSTARLAAGAPLATSDVIEATHHLDAPVVEAWLAELGQGFGIDARQLARLDAARVPAGVIDLMVALSYPKVFAINGATRTGEFREEPTGERGGTATNAARRPGPVAMIDWWDPFGYSPYYGYGYRYGLPYGYYSRPGYGYGYGFGYGYGWYPGDRPVVVVVRPPAGEPAPAQRPRVVNGRGYTQDDRPGASRGERPARSASGSDTRSAGASATSGSSSAAGSSSSSGESGRTAKPRPPGGSN